ncbi:MAG: hypothetical protein M0P04_11280 [Syntrophales bacterium]|nr:hypothetical protein [Syntrophales bacterium]
MLAIIGHPRHRGRARAMNHDQVIRQKIILKRQAIRWIQDEIKELRFQANLRRMKTDLEKQMREGFDRSLSLRIDAVNSLLDGYGRHNESETAAMEDQGELWSRKMDDVAFLTETST